MAINNDIMEENTDVNADSATQVDENMATFVFGNVVIRDLNTDEVLVNLRF